MNCAITKNSTVTQLIAVLAFAGLATILSPAPASAADEMVVAANTSKAGMSAAQSEADLRLTLDKVSLDMDTGKLDEARALINKLKAKYPDNSEVLAAEADLNNQTMESAPIAAVSEVCLPDSLNPANEDILQRAHASARHNYACGGYNRRVTNEAVEQIENLGGQVAVFSPGFSLSADLENDHLNSRVPFTRVNGIINDFYGNRQRGTFALDKTFGGNNEVAGSIFALDNTAGAGAQYARRDRWGGTSINAYFNQPDWDYVESIVGYGTKTGIAIERKQNFSDYLQAILSAGYNSYSLDHLSDAADAPGWNFNLDYDRPVNFFNQPPTNPAWAHDQITLGAHYNVQAEYFTFVNHRTDSNGNPFHPLPSTSYEVHSFTISAAKTLLPHLDVVASGGYGVNRYSGNSAPLYGGTLTYTPWPHFGIDIHGSRDLLGGQNEGEKEDIVGSNLKITW